MRSILVFAVLLVSWVRLAHADATDDRRALVMLRVLAYDKRLADRVEGDDIRIAVIYAADAGGEAERARWVAALAGASKLKVQGRPVVVSALRYENPRALARALRDLRVAAVVCTDGLGRQLAMADLAAVTRAHKVLTLTTRAEEVREGVAVGVVPGAVRDEIVVNLPAAAAEGVKFDAGLLRLVRVVGPGTESAMRARGTP